MLLSAQALGIKQSKIKALAIAIELLHASSLVHDDLPALDNDSLRRGRPTVHVKFGEAAGILIGDALLGEAFRILAEAEVPAAVVGEYAKVYRTLCEGQMLDLDVTIDSWERVEERHRKKTGAMIHLAVTAPCFFLERSAESAEKTETLSRFGAELGVLFQLVDDIRDATKSSEVLGKTSQLDKQLGRVTAVSFLGLEEARKEAVKTATQAKQLLDESSIEGLGELVDYLILRLEE